MQLAVIVRSYDAETVGNYQLIQAWLFLITAFSCFGGIVMIATRDLTQQPEAEHTSIFSTAILLQIVVAIPLTIVTVLFFRSLLPQIAFPLGIGTVALLIGMLLQHSQSLLIGRELIDRVVFSALAGHLVATLLICLAALNGVSLAVLIIAWTTFHLAQGMILLVLSHAWKKFEVRTVRRELLGKLAREALPVLMMIVATHLYVRIDIIMLDYFTAKEVVAHYGAAYLFLDQLMILSNFMMSALFPNFAHTTEERGRNFQLLYQGILRLFTKYLLPLACLIALLSYPLLGTIFGAPYKSAATSLSLLMIAALFAWLNGPSGTIFISLRKQHIYMWATLLSLLVNILGNLLLIPVFGADGAAMATIATEFAICFFCLHWIYKETGFLPWMRISTSH